MRFTRLFLQNWRDFRHVDVALRDGTFLVGPNASGKSNLLDAFRFLQEITEPRGGFQQAVQDPRGGVSRLRSLHARRTPGVIVEVALELGPTPWRYRLAFGQDNVRRPRSARSSKAACPWGRRSFPGWRRPTRSSSF